MSSRRDGMYLGTLIGTVQVRFSPGCSAPKTNSRRSSTPLSDLVNARSRQMGAAPVLCAVIDMSIVWPACVRGTRISACTLAWPFCAVAGGGVQFTPSASSPLRAFSCSMARLCSTNGFACVNCCRRSVEFACARRSRQNSIW